MPEYFITPVAKPRMTRRDKWAKRKCVIHYLTFCYECRAAKMEIPKSGGHILFVFPMPPSWSKQKKEIMTGQPHEQKPDVDNCLKAILDAVYKDDSVVWDIRVTKVWGKDGKIVVSNLRHAEK